jgi:Protein of unknown function (DUF3000)
VPDSVAASPNPPAFARAVAALQAARTRPELTVTEIAAPASLAPSAIALAADVIPARHGIDSALGTGRFILLHDPAAPEAWGGEFRIVCFAQSPLDTDMGVDPFMAEVAWSWLVDALATSGAKYHSASGTATKILSTGFGQLQSQGDGAVIELRASWTPLDADIGPHVEGWSELLCMLAGLPPAVEGVSLLSLHKGSPRSGAGSKSPAPSRS